MSRDRSYYLESLGCIANRTDAARVSSFLERNGFKATATVEDASILLLMTCAFDRLHEDENITRVEQLLHLKSPQAELIVGGCLPGINGNRLSSVFSGPTFTPRTLHRLNDILPVRTAIQDVRTPLEDPDTGMTVIRVSTGCMHHCAFCAIPFANGRTMSRAVTDILADIRAEFDRGARVFRFVSEDVGAYGLDCGSSIVTLLDSVRKLDLPIRLYLDYMNLQWVYRFKHELMSLFDSEIIGKHFYWPVQSGSDRILSLMHRGYTVSQVREILDMAFDKFPGVEVTSDWIVGFPTETADDFEATRILMRAYPFHYSNLFKYEDRPRTEGIGMDGKIAEEERERRLQTLAIDSLASVLSNKRITRLEDLAALSQRPSGLLNVNSRVL